MSALPIGFAIIFWAISSTTFAHEGHHHEPSHAASKPKGANFILTSVKGSVSLSDFKGKVVAIYFGYTHCTDACPTDLHKLSKALKSLSPSEADQVQALFVTVDPARDDAKTMANYSSSFYPNLIGLSGSDAEVMAAAKAYGISYEKGPVDAKGGYDVEHPTDISVVGRDGKFLRSLNPRMSAEQIASELRKAFRTQ